VLMPLSGDELARLLQRHSSSAQGTVRGGG